MSLLWGFKSGTIFSADDRQANLCTLPIELPPWIAYKGGNFKISVMWKRQKIQGATEKLPDFK